MNIIKTSCLITAAVISLTPFLQAKGNAKFNELPIVSYCNAQGEKPDKEFITTIEFGDVNNTPVDQDNPLGNGQTGYSDFTNFSEGYNIGETINLKLRSKIIDASDLEYYTVWVDWNQDESFSSSEKIETISRAYVIGTDPIDLVLFSFAIPNDAADGQTRMRIAMKRGSEASACGSLENGEVEDYTLQISDGSPPPNGYCFSDGEKPWEEYITTVNYGAVNHIPISSNFPNGNGKNGYGDFSNISDNALKGYTFELGVIAYLKNIPKGDYYYCVWIDLNQNGLFTDVNEKVVHVVRNYPEDPFLYDTLNLIPFIPANAISGSTRMRISMKRGAEPQSCENFEYGEVEDYTIIIEDLPTPPPPPPVFTLLSENVNDNWTFFGDILYGTYREKYAITQGENDLLTYRILDLKDGKHEEVKTGFLFNTYGTKDFSIGIGELKSGTNYRFELLGANKEINQYIQFKKI